MLCPACKVEMIAVERAPKVSGAGLFGALIGLIGLGVLFANALVGIGLIIVGLLIGGLLRRKRLLVICPTCKTEQPIT